MDNFARASSVLWKAQGVFALSSLDRDDDDYQDDGYDDGGDHDEDDDYEGTSAPLGSLPSRSLVHP